jgi:hypothetical protein
VRRSPGMMQASTGQKLCVTNPVDRYTWQALKFRRDNLVCWSERWFGLCAGVAASPETRSHGPGSDVWVCRGPLPGPDLGQNSNPANGVVPGMIVVCLPPLIAA